MRIKPLRSIAGAYGRLQRNRPAVIDDLTAERLIKGGLAIAWPEVEAGTGTEAGGRPAAGPLAATPPAGGRTGAARPSSSSAPGRAPRKRRSPPPADAPAS